MSFLTTESIVVSIPLIYPRIANDRHMEKETESLTHFSNGMLPSLYHKKMVGELDTSIAHACTPAC